MHRSTDFTENGHEKATAILPGGGVTGAQTLAKGLKLLELVGDRQGAQGVGLLELARELGWHKSTTHRLLSTLVNLGYVQQESGGGRYRLGIMSFHLGAAFTRDLELRREASFVLSALQDETEQGISLVILEPATREVIFIDRVEGTHPLRMHTHIGMRFPCNCTAAGKAIMAHLDEGDIMPLLSGELARRTPASLHTTEALLAQFAQIRADGYATDDEENAEGVRCVAAPIFDFTGKPVAAISISGPAVQIPVDQFPAFGGSARRAADRVSGRIGYRE